ncbi:hypothetical protein G7Y89_g552 [Cudoniella acicularis]|uniref:Uncharacterized protein n=1 Tax=Cudoniella acicularis TaxID=354080 RepID=A0A8H4RYW6_9HELO|nr:hypothetical protein G7Y89_g552 [Cudoniella acicularis]
MMRRRSREVLDAAARLRYSSQSREDAASTNRGRLGTIDLELDFEDNVKHGILHGESLSVNFSFGANNRDTRWLSFNAELNFRAGAGDKLTSRKARSRFLRGEWIQAIILPAVTCNHLMLVRANCVVDEAFRNFDRAPTMMKKSGFEAVRLAVFGAAFQMIQGRLASSEKRRK